ASKASLILATIPALTAALSALTLHERIGAARALGVGLSVCGVVAIVAADRAATWQSGQLSGDLLIVASALAWAGYTVLGKGLQRRVTPAVLSAATVGLGAIMLLPFAGYEALRQPLRVPSPAGWLAIAYLGLIASTVPFLLWNRALRSLDASEAAVYTNLVPFVAVVSAMLLLGETLAPLQLVGGVLVVAGVWAASVNALPGAGRRR
ncbi:MAG TPA: DMT family transporter, partial [Anaerolineae bacterium]|nr:DMT family transporter [Anaerolineae bacterium]